MRRNIDDSKSAISKVVAIIIIVVIIIAGAITALALFELQGPFAVSLSVSSPVNVGVAGQPISFAASSNVSSASLSSVNWNFGDGGTQTTTSGSATHTFQDGGTYLISAQASASVSRFLSSLTGSANNYRGLLEMKVQANLSQSQGQIGSVPTIDFSPSLNTKAPIFASGETVHPFGAFLEVPGNANWSIQSYSWDFGNGKTQTVSANSSTFLPVQNVTTSYSNPGIYTIKLTITTGDNSSTFTVTTQRTVAVTSGSLLYAIATPVSQVINPGVITEDMLSGGSPVTFDPQIVYDAVSNEIPMNIYQTLLVYNGSSTTSFIPDLATQIPTQQNGGISSDFTNYTFTIRNNQYFSNGDKVTAFDVWFSFVRELGFLQTGSGLATGGEMAQYLIPGAQNGTVNPAGNNSYAVVTSVFSYNNASNTFTIHFNRAMNPVRVYSLLDAPIIGNGVVDAAYAESVGAGFSESNWYTWEQQVNPQNYNLKMQYDPVGSGPFMLQSYTPGQSAVLVPNPHYGGVPGIPAINYTVVVNYVKDPETAVLQLQDGQADSAGGINGLPPSDFPIMDSLQAQGKLNINSFESLNLFFYLFNIYVYKNVETQQFGAGYNEPANYFADLPTRYAWINAFDYQGYVNNILGNKQYNTTFGTPVCSTIPNGMSYAQPCSVLGGLPQQNLADAKGNFSVSAWKDMKITIPIVSLTGDPVTLAASEEWASILSQISGGNITAKPIQISHGQEIGDVVGGSDPMAVYWQNQEPGTSDPIDMVDIILKQNVFGFAEGNGWNVTTFQSQVPNNPSNLVMINGTGYTQAQVDAWMNGNMSLADNSANPAVREAGYRLVQIYAVDLGLLTMLYQQNFFWFWRSWLGGIQYQENPIIAGYGTLLYYWITK